ncbi:TPA: hypothetical protein ENS27_07195 [bacterium]|nr:hypothetical protein [bacterium]
MPAFYTDQSIKTRVMSMDGYVRSIPLIIGDSLEIATYDALDSIYVEYSRRGIFPTQTEFETNLTNCITCGRMGSCVGAMSGAVCVLMNSTDLLSIEARLVNLSSQHLNINTTFSLYDLDVIQNYPYDVDVYAEIGYTVSDNSFGIKWTKRENITRIVSIIGLKDPLVGINTAQGYEKVIFRSAICEFNDTCWDYNRTKAFYNEQKFTYAINGTSFLSRYWNSTSPSRCCGIESFMNVTDYRNVSFLDHYYFSGEYSCPQKTILSYSTISTYFKLDSETAGRYGISDNGTLLCRS